MTRCLAPLAALIAIAAPPAARAAESFSTTNLQLLHGWDFNDPIAGSDTRTGHMTTLTLNHFSTWEYGDNFFFADILRGDFKPGLPQDAQIYGEWHPRLFLNKIAGAKAPLFGIFRNWGFAGEYNQSGNGFYAYLAGLGVDLALPFPYSVGLNVYYRYDKFAGDQWQVSPFWNLPFSLGVAPFLLSGFVDVNGTKDASGNEGLEIMAQPELLLDLLGLAGATKNRLYLGIEWYWHRLPAYTTSAPQIMAQWTLY
jgi:nucleoside-specific outer membrane channel protein Tsx